MSDINLPENLLYTKDHEWIDLSAKPCRMGITDFAQDQLGDIVYIDLPQAGSVTKKGDVLASIESVKSVSDIYSPVSGEVAAVNERLESEPELVNRETYGEGWLCAITPSREEEEKETLLGPGDYRATIESD